MFDDDEEASALIALLEAALRSLFDSCRPGGERTGEDPYEVGDKGLVGDFSDARREVELLLLCGIANGEGEWGWRAVVGGEGLSEEEVADGEGGGTAVIDCTRPVLG